MLALVSRRRSPNMFGGDFRPFLTFLGEDAAEVIRVSKADGGPSQPMLVGVTNPFFLKALVAWPNILVLGSSVIVTRGEPLRANVRVVSDPQKAGRCLDATMNESAVPTRSLLVRRRRSLVGPDTSLLTKLKVPTRVVMDAASALVTVADASSSYNSNLIRTHFAQMLNDFLRPFESYFRAPAKPTDRPKSSSKALLQEGRTMTGTGQRFDPLTFFPTLRGASKRRVNLYRLFVYGPNFKPWYARRMREARYRILQNQRRICMKTTPESLVRFLRGSPGRRRSVADKIRGAILAERTKPQDERDEKYLIAMAAHLAALSKESGDSSAIKIPTGE